MIKSIAHVADLATSLKFYCDVLQIPLNSNRPKFAYDGAWLDLDNKQQLHLMVLPNPDSTDGRPEHGGRDRHVALLVEDLEALAERLEQAGVEFSRSKSGRAAFFCRDPDGNAHLKETINGLATYSQFLWISLCVTMVKNAKSLIYKSAVQNG